MKQLKPDFIHALEELQKMNGGEIFAGLSDELARGVPSTSVRVNRLKGVTVPIDVKKVPWNLDGFYLAGERPRFTFDPALHQGLYYVQDPSSMVVGTIVERLTSEMGPIVCIDSCAAPGGKTTAVIDALPADSLMIANEFDSSRAEALKENIIKWGSPNVVVSRGDTARLSSPGPIADVILADVPCSGEGMMRKDDDAVAQWSRGLIDGCAALQREIVSNVWEALKPGGFLIYSTCTFNSSENEDNVRWIAETLGGEVIEAPIEPVDGIARGISISSATDDIARRVRRFIPGRVDGEGLFVAVIRKVGNDSGEQIVSKSKNKNRQDRKVNQKTRLPDVSVYLGEDYSCVDDNGSIYALPARWAALIENLQKKLHIIYKGVEIGQIKGRDLVPAQALALSTALRPNVFPTEEIDYPTAIAYLRREAIMLPEGSPRGLVLLTYGGRPLGFVKNLGNRSNNLFPKQFAIRSTYAPTLPPSVL